MARLAALQYRVVLRLYSYLANIWVLVVRMGEKVQDNFTN